MEQQKWSSAPNDAVDEQLIAEAIAAGRVRYFPIGHTSDWDALPFRQRRALIFNSGKKSKSGS